MSVDDQRLVDMDGDHFTQRHPAVQLITRRIAQADELRQAAFEVDRAFEYSRCGDQPARCPGHLGEFELVDLGRRRRAARIHRFRQRPGSQFQQNSFVAATLATGSFQPIEAKPTIGG